MKGDLYDIFQRQREEAFEPVVKEDVAQVLRRRFFTPESIKNKDAFRPHVAAALKGIVELDEQTRKEAGDAEERYLKSYRFHPDLTEVFYTKWTSLVDLGISRLHRRPREPLRRERLACVGRHACPLVAGP